MFNLRVYNPCTVEQACVSCQAPPIITAPVGQLTKVEYPVNTNLLTIDPKSEFSTRIDLCGDIDFTADIDDSGLAVKWIEVADHITVFSQDTTKIGTVETVQVTADLIDYPYSPTGIDLRQTRPLTIEFIECAVSTITKPVIQNVRYTIGSAPLLISFTGFESEE